MLRDTFFAAAAAVLFCLAFPVFAISFGKSDPQPCLQTACAEQTVSQRKNAPPPVREKPVQTAANTAQTQTGAGFDLAFRLPVQFDSGVDSMTLHDYLVGALVGEMPLSFEPEALKAQAVACRTYALRQYTGRKHDPAAVCTASSCCECWVSAETAERELREKAEQAVSETDGLVLTWEGKLIEATFFSCSGGRTEAAADVWGSDIPYLKAVDSPGEEAAPRCFGEVTVSYEEFCEKLQAEDSTVSLPGKLTADCFTLTDTAGGGVKTVRLGGAEFSGKTFRKLFGLNSTAFTVETDGSTVTFRTKGFGHRVGLSQYGAQAMAQSGATFRAILEHYYSGAELTDCRTLFP